MTDQAASSHAVPDVPDSAPSSDKEATGTPGQGDSTPVDPSVWEQVFDLRG